MAVMQAQDMKLQARGTVTPHPPVPEGESCPTHGAECKAYPQHNKDGN